MTYVSVNNQLYPATVTGLLHDESWDNRSSKAVTLSMNYAEAIQLFQDGTKWSIITETPVVQSIENESGELVDQEVMEKEEFDNSDYTLAGDVIDHRDGTVTVKMGKLTELEEAYELLFGGN